MHKSRIITCLVHLVDRSEWWARGPSVIEAFHTVTLEIVHLSAGAIVVMKEDDTMAGVHLHPFCDGGITEHRPVHVIW